MLVVPAMAVTGASSSTGCDEFGNPLPVKGIPVIFNHTQKQSIIPGSPCDPNSSKADPIVFTNEVLTEGILSSDVGETKNVDSLIENITTIYWSDCENGGLREYNSRMYFTVAICDGIYERINFIRSSAGVAKVVYSADIESDAQGFIDEVVVIPESVSDGLIGNTTLNPNSATYTKGKDLGFRIVDGWKADDDQNEILLDSNYTNVGIGIRYNDTTWKYDVLALFKGGEVESEVVEQVVVKPVKTIIIPTVTPKPTTTIPTTPDLISKAIVMYTNIERVKANLPAIELDPKLSGVAQGHSNDMKENNYFSHTSPDGDTLTERLSIADYLYSVAGENIARSNAFGKSANANAVGKYFVGLWMNSTGHRDTMLDERFNKVGIGISYDNSLGYIITMDLTAPPKVSDVIADWIEVKPEVIDEPIVVPSPTPIKTPAPISSSVIHSVANSSSSSKAPTTIPTSAPTTIPTTIVPTKIPTTVPTTLPTPEITSLVQLEISEPTPSSTPIPISVFVPEPTFATHLQPYIQEGADTNLFYNLNSVMSVFSWW
jgi:uncharacterized protein YkwD